MFVQHHGPDGNRHDQVGARTAGALGALAVTAPLGAERVAVAKSEQGGDVFSRPQDDRAALAAVTAGGLVLAVAMLRRGLTTSAGWHAAITEHHAATGDYPTVAQWRAGLLATPALADEVAEGPVVVDVTVTDLPEADRPRNVPPTAQLPGGAR